MSPLLMSLATNHLVGEVGFASILKLIRSPQYASVYNCVVIVLLTVIGLGLSWACVSITRRTMTPATANPRKLFLQLCRAHELTSGERRTLESHAELVGIEDPSILMIDVSRWQLEELRKQNKLRPAQYDRLQTLQRMLYDQPRMTVVMPN